MPLHGNGSAFTLPRVARSAAVLVGLPALWGHDALTFDCSQEDAVPHQGHERGNVLRCTALGLVLLGCVAATPAQAQYAEPNLTFIYPLLTRRPVIERELELKLEHAKGLGAHETEAAAAIEWPLLPRLQIELEVPFVVNAPDDAPTLAGFGDVTLEAKLQVWKSVQYRTLGALGLEQRFPTGSSARGLGGAHSLEPFLAAGIALGPFDLLGEVAYEWVLNGEEHPHEQDFTARLTLGYPVSWWFRPLLEVSTVTQTRGPATPPGETALLHKTQVSLVPGFNIRPRPWMTLRVGVEVPVTTAKAFDYRFLSALVLEF